MCDFTCCHSFVYVQARDFDANWGRGAVSAIKLAGNYLAFPSGECPNKSSLARALDLALAFLVSGMSSRPLSTCDHARNQVKPARVAPMRARTHAHTSSSARSQERMQDACLSASANVVSRWVCCLNTCLSLASLHSQPPPQGVQLEDAPQGVQVEETAAAGWWKQRLRGGRMSGLGEGCLAAVSAYTFALG